MTEPNGSDAAGRFEGRRHRLPLRVYWEDTDAGGIVYYANYLRYAERGRTEMLRHAGVGQAALMAHDGVMFTVRNCDIAYLDPARLDDRIVVESVVRSVGGASVGMDQTIARDGLDLARCRLRLACVGRTGRPARMPPDLRRLFMSLLESAGDQTHGE